MSNFRLHSLAAGRVAKATRRSPASEVSTIRVDPNVWGRALMLAQGDYRRLDVIDSKTVIVRNRRVR